MLALLDIDTVNQIIYFVTFVFAYGLIVTLAGSFKARIAARWGDCTAAELGFTDLDPLQHIDLFGFLFFIFSGFGWGHSIPIVFDHIRSPYKKLKVMVAAFADTIAYIAIACAMVFAFLITFGYPLLNFAIQSIRHGSIPSQYIFSQVAPAISSLHIIVLFVYVIFIYVCVLFGAISAVINFFHMFLDRIMERADLQQLGPSFSILRLVLLYVLFLFMLGPIHSIVLTIIHYSSAFFAYCLGVLN